MSNKEKFVQGLDDDFDHLVCKAYLTYPDCDEKRAAKCKEKAEKVITVMQNLLCDYKGLRVFDGQNYARWFQVMMVSAYLYFLTFDEKRPHTSIFRAREEFSGYASEQEITLGEQEILWQTIESALGFYGAVKLKALPDTPAEMFALALYLVKAQDNKKLFE